jgi:hypothetical protein
MTTKMHQDVKKTTTLAQNVITKEHTYLEYKHVMNEESEDFKEVKMGVLKICDLLLIL